VAGSNVVITFAEGGGHTFQAVSLGASVAEFRNRVPAPMPGREPRFHRRRSSRSRMMADAPISKMPLVLPVDRYSVPGRQNVQ
jgi:hypothetical protein